MPTGKGMCLDGRQKEMETLWLLPSAVLVCVLGFYAQLSVGFPNR
jgi:hypothetical protein